MAPKRIAVGVGLGAERAAWDGGQSHAAPGRCSLNHTHEGSL